MDSEHNGVSEREQRLDEVVLVYLKAREAGQQPDHQELLDRHADLLPELAQFFEDADALGGLALRPCSVPSAAALTGESVSGTITEGKELGDFRIVREVGKGGMGIVYEAEQLSLRRRVALKVLPFAATMDPRHLQRFHNEAQAAACLHHANIVPVHFVGCERGVHFYAMQFIDGQPLSEIICQLRRAAKPQSVAGNEQKAASALPSEGAPQTSPTTRLVAEVTPLSGEGRRGRDYYRKVAELVAQAAEALDHAHQLGIVHRDVKPANLLLDARGNLWITDFGLAQVQSETRLTLTGDMVGTLRYMSPEQALAKRLVLDHRTDVYSLGATLYELLTLRPAFPSEDRQELLRQIAFEEPARPRRLERTIPEVLETIVLKATEKRPQDRYATAQEMADDLRHWLDNRPIRARRSSWWERLRKWVRRRPALAGLVAVSILSVLGLVIGLLWHNDQLRDAAEREHNQAEQANQQKENAQKQRAFARQAADQMYTRVVEKWLVSEPGSEKLQREFLEEALRFYEELAREPDADSSVQRELVNAYRRIGEIHLKLGRLSQAEQALGKAVDIAEKIAAEHPDQAVYQTNLASIYYQLGNLNRQTSRPQESEAFFRKSLAIQRKLAVLFPSDAGYRQKIGTALINLGHVLTKNGRQSEAEEAFREARSVLEQVTAESPEAAHYHVSLGGALNNLAILVAQAGKPAEARDLLEEAIRHQKAALRINPRQKAALQFLDNHYSCLSQVLRQLGEKAKALDAIRESIAVGQRLVAEFPEFPDHRSSLAISQHTFGAYYLNSGHPEEAESAYRSALATMEKAAVDLPHAAFNKRMLADFHSSLARALEAKGRHRDARAEYQKALQQYPDNVAALNNLALLLADHPDSPSRDPARAVEMSNRAVELQPKSGPMWRTLGVVRYRAGDWKGAVKALEKAQQLLGRDEEIAWLFLAMAHWRAGDQAQGRMCYDRAKDLAKGNKPPQGDLSRYRAEAADLIGGIDRPVPNRKGAQPPEK